MFKYKIDNSYDCRIIVFTNPTAYSYRIYSEGISQGVLPSMSFGIIAYSIQNKDGCIKIKFTN